MEILFRRKPTQQDLAFAYRDHERFMALDRRAFAERFEPLFLAHRPAVIWSEMQRIVGRDIERHRQAVERGNY
jgi:hypothetical protein